MLAYIVSGRSGQTYGDKKGANTSLSGRVDVAVIRCLVSSKSSKRRGIMQEYKRSLCEEEMTIVPENDQAFSEYGTEGGYRKWGEELIYKEYLLLGRSF